jgi:hypothetical protein
MATSRINWKPTTPGMSSPVGLIGGGIQLPALPTSSLTSARLIGATPAVRTLASDTQSLAVISSAGGICRIGQAPVFVSPQSVSATVGTTPGTVGLFSGSPPSAVTRLVLPSTTAPTYIRMRVVMNITGPSDPLKLYAVLYDVTANGSGSVSASGALVNSTTPLLAAACGDSTSAKARLVEWEDMYTLGGGTWSDQDELAIQIFAIAGGNTSVTLAGAVAFQLDSIQDVTI